MHHLHAGTCCICLTSAGPCIAKLAAQQTVDKLKNWQGCGGWLSILSLVCKPGTNLFNLFQSSDLPNSSAPTKASWHVERLGSIQGVAREQQKRQHLTNQGHGVFTQCSNGPFLASPSTRFFSNISYVTKKTMDTKMVKTIVTILQV